MKCYNCDGKGVVNGWDRNPDVDVVEPCEECDGTGEVDAPFEDCELKTLGRRGHCPTFYADIYIGTDKYSHMAVATKEYVNKVGLCVSITRCEYHYTGGWEPGYCIRLINYPKYPRKPEEISEHADKLAMMLLNRCGLNSYSIVTPNITMWYDKRSREDEASETK